MNGEKFKIALVNLLTLTLVFGFLEISSGYLMAYRRQRGSQLMHLTYKLKTKFVDINLETLNIDEDQIVSAISKKTKAIIAVNV